MAHISGLSINGGNEYLPIRVTPDGKVKIDGDPTSLYKITDIDDVSDPEYYGYVDANGAWYILKIDVTNQTYRYASGASGYPAAWTARTIQDYGYFYDKF